MNLSRRWTAPWCILPVFLPSRGILAWGQPQQYHPSHEQYLGGWGTLSKSFRLQHFTVITRCIMSGIWKSMVTFPLTFPFSLCCSACGLYRGIITDVIHQCDRFSSSWWELCVEELDQAPAVEFAHRFACEKKPTVDFVSVELYLSVYKHIISNLLSQIMSIIPESF